MHEVAGLERIKFVTNFPKDMSDDLLDAVRELPKLCKYLHVPVQSGCDDVLKRMKRQYTVESYREMLHRCRERVPGVAVISNAGAVVGRLHHQPTASAVSSKPAAAANGIIGRRR